jgi:dolichol-phosphate mannosyltransferase
MIFGYIIAILAFLYGIYAIAIKLFTNQTVSGWTSLLVGFLFIGGIQMIMIGILGEYIGRLFIESKKRPNYIIRDKSYE